MRRFGRLSKWTKNGQRKGRHTNTIHRVGGNIPEMLRFYSGVYSGVYSGIFRNIPEYSGFYSGYSGVFPGAGKNTAENFSKSFLGCSRKVGTENHIYSGIFRIFRNIPEWNIPVYSGPEYLPPPLPPAEGPLHQTAQKEIFRLIPLKKVRFSWRSERKMQQKRIQNAPRKQTKPQKTWKYLDTNRSEKKWARNAQRKNSIHLRKPYFL